MTDRAEMMQRGRAALSRAEVELADYTGSCANCVYFRNKSLLDDFDKECVHPVVKAASFLVDQGYKRERFIDPDYQRGTNHVYGNPLCGRNGFLFESKKVVNKESFWSRIKSWFS